MRETSCNGIAAKVFTSLPVYRLNRGIHAPSDACSTYLLAPRQKVTRTLAASRQLPASRFRTYVGTNFFLDGKAASLPAPVLKINTIHIARARFLMRFKNGMERALYCIDC